jgi:phenylacetate-CoA ligase
MSKHSAIYGKTFWETYDFLQKSQRWSRNKLEEYQMQQLNNLLCHVYQNVPFYTKVFNELDIKPKDIQTKDDLKKLPVMTRDIFRNNFSELVAVNMDDVKMPGGHTSGMTGNALQFFTSDDIKQKELAFIFHQWSRVGYKPGQPRIEIRGAVSDNDSRIVYDPGYNVFRFSPRIENKEAAQYYLDNIKDFKADFIYGYSSAIASFAHIIKKYGLIVPRRFKAVLFSSENIYDWQRQITSEVFNCRLFSHYGQCEQVVIAAECESSAIYHCAPQYGVTEFDDKTDEIISTGFLNNVNPFIRYRTYDIASGISSYCEQCHRAYYPVFKNIEGRLGDYLVTSRGLFGPAIMTFPFKDLKTIRDTQIIQKSPDQTVIKVVSWPDKDPLLHNDEIEFLKKSLHDILGTDMNIEVEKVEEIERQTSGKYKWIISNISQDVIEKGLRSS